MMVDPDEYDDIDDIIKHFMNYNNTTDDNRKMSSAKKPKEKLSLFLKKHKDNDEITLNICKEENR